MLERGLLPDFSSEVLAELGRLQHPATFEGNTIRDLRQLLWASIDNDDSRDLDQLSVAEAMPADRIKVLVAIADVDSSIPTAPRWTSTPATTPPRSIPLLKYSRCCRKKSPPISLP